MSNSRRDGVGRPEAEALCVSDVPVEPARNKTSNDKERIDVVYLELTIYLECCSIFDSIH